MQANEIVIKADQVPGRVVFSNYSEVKEQLLKGVALYAGKQYSVDDIDEAQNDCKTLKAVRDKISKAQKELKEAYSKPYLDVDEKLNELLEIIDKPYKQIKAFVDTSEKEAKALEIKKYARQQAAVLGEYADKIIASPAFFNQSWLLKKYTAKKYQDEIDQTISQAAADITKIKNAGGKNGAALLARYYETLSLDGAKAFVETLNADYTDGSVGLATEDDKVKGFKVLKITATESQMASILDELSLMGVDVEEIEDGMPKEMPEKTEPDFNSFVAFDIETTGTFGAGNGDAEAAITEIGAVRVVDGQIVEKFDELANPGRKIVPRIARITHITDEMVADKPPVDEVIKSFKDFVGDDVLVGHNIKSSDLHYISRAAKKAGVKLENPFFDTYIFARRFKKAQGWEKLNLGYLAEKFSINHQEAHRAWSDAETNAEVYFALKKIE